MRLTVVMLFLMVYKPRVSTCTSSHIQTGTTKHTHQFSKASTLTSEEIFKNPNLLKAMYRHRDPEVEVELRRGNRRNKAIIDPSLEEHKDDCFVFDQNAKYDQQALKQIVQNFRGTLNSSEENENHTRKKRNVERHQHRVDKRDVEVTDATPENENHTRKKRNVERHQHRVDKRDVEVTDATPEFDPLLGLEDFPENLPSTRNHPEEIKRWMKEVWAMCSNEKLNTNDTICHQKAMENYNQGLLRNSTKSFAQYYKEAREDELIDLHKEKLYQQWASTTTEEPVKYDKNEVKENIMASLGPFLEPPPEDDTLDGRIPPHLLKEFKRMYPQHCTDGDSTNTEDVNFDGCFMGEFRNERKRRHVTEPVTNQTSRNEQFQFPNLEKDFGHAPFYKRLKSLLAKKKLIEETLGPTKTTSAQQSTEKSHFDLKNLAKLWTTPNLKVTTSTEKTTFDFDPNKPLSQILDELSPENQDDLRNADNINLFDEGFLAQAKAKLRNMKIDDDNKFSLNLKNALHKMKNVTPEQGTQQNKPTTVFHTKHSSNSTKLVKQTNVGFSGSSENVETTTKKHSSDPTKLVKKTNASFSGSSKNVETTTKEGPEISIDESLEHFTNPEEVGEMHHFIGLKLSKINSKKAQKQNAFIKTRPPSTQQQLPRGNGSTVSQPKRRTLKMEVINYRDKSLSMIENSDEFLKTMKNKSEQNKYDDEDDSWSSEEDQMSNSAKLEFQKEFADFLRNTNPRNTTRTTDPIVKHFMKVKPNRKSPLRAEVFNFSNKSRNNFEQYRLESSDESNLNNEGKQKMFGLNRREVEEWSAVETEFQNVKGKRRNETFCRNRRAVNWLPPRKRRYESESGWSKLENGTSSEACAFFEKFALHKKPKFVKEWDAEHEKYYRYRPEYDDALQRDNNTSDEAIVEGDREAARKFRDCEDYGIRSMPSQLREDDSKSFLHPTDKKLLQEFKDATPDRVMTVNLEYSEEFDGDVSKRFHRKMDQVQNAIASFANREKEEEMIATTNDNVPTRDDLKVLSVPKPLITKTIQQTIKTVPANSHTSEASKTTYRMEIGDSGIIEGNKEDFQEFLNIDVDAEKPREIIGVKSMEKLLGKTLGQNEQSQKWEIF